MRQKILKLIIILLFGGLGGVLADQFFLPYLADIPPFSKIEFIRQAKNGTTIVNKTEKVIITENTALEEAIRQVSPSVVAIQARVNKKVIRQGTGFIIFSDGLVMTAGDLVLEQADQYLVIQEGISWPAQVLKKDLKNNLALLKIEATNLPVVSMANLEELSLGERIILMGLEIQNDNLYRFINIGTIRGIKKEILLVNLSEENPLANGGPLINIKGQVIGLNLVNQQGLVKIVPTNKIKELIGY
jgi:S1-C subfamily serine protease